jgi:opacity protein-like surface antigen
MSKIKISSWLVLILPILFVPSKAEALINAGVEGGIVKRYADSPNDLKLGFAYGVYGEVDLLPVLKLGPYYLHYELSSADRPAPGAADAVFNTLGLRARVMLPLPGSFKPYAYAGAGHIWANYSPVTGDRMGHLLEIPIGLGAAYEVVEIFQVSLDAAYRPAVDLGGDAFNGRAAISRPTNGWSLLLGATLDL